MGKHSWEVKLAIEAARWGNNPIVSLPWNVLQEALDETREEGREEGHYEATEECDCDD